ncbi:YczE/YyaS/YitT family protein [Glutamicibacter endophyticus]|uniref:membrane protein YczE n=1 Tax=Glutamicibacter endophyticus TaxID=1522174 RepID=UPI003AF01261
MTITNLTPREQFAAGRLPLRFTALFLGLTLYALAMALLVRAGLGVDPWDVFHLGLATRLPLSLGTLVILVGVVVLLCWIPLRQWPGIGTIANTLWLGIALDLWLRILPEFHGLALQLLVLLGAIAINGLGGAMYIGSHFGPGPRDGLMTGIALRTGLSLRLVRTALEVSVLAIGWLLGGPVGLGTVAYAVLIGPATQFFFRFTTIRLAS